MEDIRLEGRAGRLGAVMTAVVVDGPKGKEYRVPTAHEIEMAQVAEGALTDVFREMQFGLPEEPTPKGGAGAARAFSVDGYGFGQWRKLFTPRQLVALGSFVETTHAVMRVFEQAGYPFAWQKAVAAYLAIPVDKVAAFNLHGNQVVFASRRNVSYIFWL